MCGVEISLSGTERNNIINTARALVVTVVAVVRVANVQTNMHTMHVRPTYAHLYWSGRYRGIPRENICNFNGLETARKCLKTKTT